MEFLLLGFLIFFNGLLAMSEMAIVSSRKIRLQQWAQDGRPGAGVALALANEPSRFLSTIQVGITVIGISSGAFGEKTLARDLSGWIMQYPLLAPFAEGLAITIVIACITVVSLLAGELIPKRLALINPEAIASAIATPMNLLSRVAGPAVRMLSLATDGFLKLIGLYGRKPPPVTEDDIQGLMREGQQAGVFEAHEELLVKRVFRLDEMRVTGIMTTRADIDFLDLENSYQACMEQVINNNHSRFPVVRGDNEHVLGVIAAKSVLRVAAGGQQADLSAHMTRPLFVPETVTVMELVELFKKHRQTLAIVINEFGHVQGLVTMNDVMEALVGDIASEEEAQDADVVRRDDDSWLIDGSVTIERFKDVVGIDAELPAEHANDFHTLGGFVMYSLGKVPAMADRFTWQDLELEVVDMDGHRVDKVMVTRKAGPIEAPPLDS